MLHDALDDAMVLAQILKPETLAHLVSREEHDGRVLE